MVSIPIGINSSDAQPNTVNAFIDTPLPNPFPLLASTRVLLQDVLQAQQPFSAGEPAGHATFPSTILCLYCAFTVPLLCLYCAFTTNISWRMGNFSCQVCSSIQIPKLIFF